MATSTVNENVHNCVNALKAEKKSRLKVTMVRGQ